MFARFPAEAGYEISKRIVLSMLVFTARHTIRPVLAGVPV